ncbi:MAG: DMT family transporter [Bacteroidales bacterium]|nr:DMT family transporter [Bacteroidales bacterium]
MWIWLAVGSAFMLGIYDVAKKQSLKRNSSLGVLLLATAFSTLFLSPWLSAGPLQDHLRLLVKAALVALAWISGMEGLRLLPITIASPIKASRPVFVLLFSILLFGERLNAWQWAGTVLALAALYILSLSGRKEGIRFRSNKGIAWMVVSVAAGVASALWDKHIMASMQPLFVQSWCNLYVTVLLALITGVTWLRDKAHFQPIRWDWNILLIAVFITASDALYFFSLKDSDALLSVISMLRRSSVLVTFVLGAILFKETNIKNKAIALLVLLAGMALIVFGSC